MRKLKVLIVDDVEIIAKANQQIVEKNEEIEVIGLAYDGQEEYDMILELKPDIVISDNQMPKMNGVEVVKKIFESNIANPPKFIMVTVDAEYTLNIIKQAPVIITVINTNGINPFKNIDADTKVTEICDILSIGASVENILLKATELGIGTLWIANTFFAYPELVNFIGTENQLVSAIALGYPEESPI